ncbi:NUDIX hydrolase [Streptomyces kanamyceticus]|uniref:NUDIX hydrolase n=1 Tax=Streptomyces kanamyceticus TaxID=1967 RepID=UPI0037DA5879
MTHTRASRSPFTEFAPELVRSERSHPDSQSVTNQGFWRSFWRPGGGMDLTDTLPGTAVREVKEETGLDVEITGLVGTHPDDKHIIAYMDGEVWRQFNVCFMAGIIGGQLEFSDESTELRFVRPAELDDLPTHHTHRLRLRHFLERRKQPCLR